VAATDSLIGIRFSSQRGDREKSCSRTHRPAESPTTKRLFPFVPSLIRYYLGEQPLLEQPLTIELDSLARGRGVFSRFDDFVFRPVNEVAARGLCSDRSEWRGTGCAFRRSRQCAGSMWPSPC